ncbi:hypothetical protein EUX98_g2782 [Antrodiella citrinella]|uniref:PWWP domain-containing protein n=1 Tax=Antrodiella citrinella TaxID=2447956 RepID=A0A4V3XJ23_9APHY|nr:hypothetical protein EUX98_g2782 [Antrodiella citrinella]
MSKKGSKPQTTTQQTYDLRDVVLAKVRGFPSWPGMIVDPESVPKEVGKERPNAKSNKGLWYCVRFFPAGDYAWLMAKDISKLQEHEIQAYINEPYKRSADLLQGYRIALNPTKWEEERDAARAQAEENEANAEVDQLESDAAPEAEADDDEPKKPKPKKRKRDSEAASVAPKKTPKAKTSKKGSAEPAAEKKKKAPAKKGAKSKTLVESEDDGAAEAEAEDEEDAGPSKKTSPPPAKKAKRDKDGEEDADSALSGDFEATKVRDWRHKLQKAFLNSKSLPKDEDMPALDELFSTVENYENMSIAYLTFSKIGKVMRHIHALAPSKIPRNDEFHFKERAKVLVDKWAVLINGPGGKPNGEKADTPTANGTATNGKKAKSTPPKDKGDEDSNEAMDQDAKGEDAKSGSADALADDDTPAGAEESMLADVTMSEAA